VRGEERRVKSESWGGGVVMNEPWRVERRDREAQILSDVAARGKCSKE